MPINDSTVQRGYKRLGARVWVDGQPLALVGLPTRTLSALRGRSTCVLPTQPGAPTPGRVAQVDLVIDGEVARFFTGITGARTGSSAAMEFASTLVDILDLDRVLGTAITWSGTSFADAVSDLLAAAGLSAADIDAVYDPGADYVLGAVYPIELDPAENIRSVFDELMEFGGAAAYVTPSGRVRVVSSSGTPAASSATVYAAPAGAGEFPLFDIGGQVEGNETLVSVFTATGPKTPAGLLPDGTFTATGITGKADGRQYRFAQSDTVCQAIARREVGRRARARANYWMAAPLNPNLVPGDTILIRVARAGFAAATPAYVLEVATDADAGMRVVFSTGASLLDGFDSSTPPPRADFAITVEHQLVTLAGVPVASYLVQCRDESRDPTGAAIATQSWSASGPGASPTSASGPEAIFLFTDLSGAEITLTVESESGESASVTRSPQVSTLQVLSRVVSVAAGSDGWQVLHGTSGWRSYTGAGSCTAVPSINETGPLWAGFSSGAIYKSLDALATEPVSVITLPDGAIGALWVNEADGNQLLAGSGSTLYRSTDGGVGWAPVYTFDAAITDVQSSPGNPLEIRTTAGDSLWISYDGGYSQVAIVEWGAAFDGSATAEAMATAPWGHAAVFSGSITAVQSILFEEGHTVDWSAVAAEDQPAGLTSITPLLTEQGYIAGEASDLIRDGSLESLVLTAGAGALYKLLWTGSAFAAELLTPEAASGPGKLINALNAYPIAAFGAAQIGYGALATPYPRVRLVVPPWGESGAADAIHIWQAGTWTTATVPSAGKYWQSLAINPLNPLEWLLWGNSQANNIGFDRSAGNMRMADGETAPLWRSTDGGTTWAAVELPSPAVTQTTVAMNTVPVGIQYTGVGTAWVLSGWTSTGPYRSWIWRGSGGSANAPIIVGDGSGNQIGAATAVVGQAGDVVLVPIAGVSGAGAYSNYRMVVLGLPSTLDVPTGVSGVGRDGSAIILPGTRRLLLHSGTTLYGAGDYRAGQPESLGVTLAGGWLAPMADGSVFAAGAGGVQRITDPFGAPAVAASSVATGGVVASDVATRTVAVAAAGDGTYSIWDGSAWSANIPGPAATVSQFFAVIVP